ncbi:MAG: hypothetical protein L0Y37_07900, partial [Bacteroidales bacterium]|nr:hypothetical protein [Bacteroidales bacterium]
IEMINTRTSTNYLNADTLSYFISVISEGVRHNPRSVKYKRNNNELRFFFEDSDVQADVKVSEREAHLTFELIKAEPASEIEGIAWGPVYTTVSGLIGESVGVVRNEESAIGMLVLNSKTLGGFFNENGLSEGRGSLALPFRSGSSLQAYSINRDRHREVDAMWHYDIPVKPLKGETVTGSSIVLFSCDEPDVLDRIEQVVIAEGLPYPTYKGEWTKKAFLRSRSYLISDFRESEIDEVIDYTVRGGFFSVYHEGPFKSWGHYELDSTWFPGGIEGIRRCVDKAGAAGLNFGVHTLTNFINTNDRYVSPLPDKRLAHSGYGLLKRDIAATDTVIEVSTEKYFSQKKENNVHSVLIGNEIIIYGEVSVTEPYILYGCQRGAFGTKATQHAENDTVRKLIDHGYKVFFPDIELQREIAVRLGEFFNKTGINHLDFDGYEGCQASGEGDYAQSLFAEDFFRTLDHEFVNGTSRSLPYYWYINTLCNWGEPWYGGFTESMQEYRISNQAFLSRNYYPNMLGWYMLTATTTMEEMEWMLARSAGYDAGFAMVVRMKAARGNPITSQLLDAIREWEKARLAGAFTASQRERLKDPKRMFHLEKINDNEWDLYEISAITAYAGTKQDGALNKPERITSSKQ